MNGIDKNRRIAKIKENIMLGYHQLELLSKMYDLDPAIRNVKKLEVRSTLTSLHAELSEIEG